MRLCLSVSSLNNRNISVVGTLPKGVLMLTRSLLFLILLLSISSPVAAQELAPPVTYVLGAEEIFSDGFESGDTSAWSETSQQVCVHEDFDSATENDSVEEFVSPHVSLEYIRNPGGSMLDSARYKTPTYLPSGDGLLVYVDVHNGAPVLYGELHITILEQDMHAVNFDLWCLCVGGAGTVGIYDDQDNFLDGITFSFGTTFVALRSTTNPVNKVVVFLPGEPTIAELDNLSISEFTPMDCSPGPEIPGM